MSAKEYPTLIFGTAGAAKDIYYWTKAGNQSATDSIYNVIGFIDNTPEKQNQVFVEGRKVIGTDEQAFDIISKHDRVALIVPFGFPKLRQKIVESFMDLDNVFFPNIIHPTVLYDKEAGSMGIGNHIGPGTVIASAFTFGDFNYVSIGAHLGHDINLGYYNSINPAANCAGNVVFGKRNTLGINATVIEETHIKDDIVIGGNSLVIRDLDEAGTYVGSPVRKIK